MAYPDPPDFGGIAKTTGVDYDWLNEALTFLDALIADVSAMPAQDGNIDLDTGKVIKWDGTTRISCTGATVSFTGDLEVTNNDYWGSQSVPGDVIVGDEATITNLEVTNDLNIAGAIRVDEITDTTLTLQQVAEPDDPPDGEGVMWLSNGTGDGDVGDLMWKYTVTTTTTTETAVDFSAA